MPLLVWELSAELPSLLRSLMAEPAFSHSMRSARLASCCRLSWNAFTGADAISSQPRALSPIEESGFSLSLSLLAGGIPMSFFAASSLNRQGHTLLNCSIVAAARGGWRVGGSSAAPSGWQSVAPRRTLGC